MAKEQVADTFETAKRAMDASWPYIGKAAAQNAQQFWKNQEKILDSLQELTQGWFDRRHEATRTALETAQTVGAAASPVDIVQECHNWMMRSAERVAADVMAGQKHCLNVMGCVAASLPAEAQQVKAGMMTAVRAAEKASSRAEAA